MYGRLVEARIRGIFDALGGGDHRAALEGVSEDVEHRFAGDHALGGERHGRAALELWFERLFRLFELSFEVDRVVVAGPPWDIRATVEWRAWVVPRAGEPYENVGAHLIRIRRGRVTEIHAYEDSQRVAAACDAMAAAGIEEASAPPITSA